LTTVTKGSGKEKYTYNELGWTNLCPHHDMIDVDNKRPLASYDSLPFVTNYRRMQSKISARDAHHCFCLQKN